VLGLEINGEGKPLIKHPDTSNDWWGTTLTVMSYGYEVKQTPLQTLTYYNAIANNGKMVKPVFVTEVRTGDVVKERFGTEVINNKIASQSTIDSIKSLLEGVVTRGTARRPFYGTPYKVAGKTGTAKIATAGEYRRNYNASFVGYFPADHPKYSCIVSINKPSEGGYYGGSVAAPAFREIADKVYSTSLVLDMDYETNFAEAKKPVEYHPSYYDDLKTIYASLGIQPVDYLNNDPWAMAVEDNDSIELESVEFPKVVVPNVKGMKAKDAVYLLENLGLKTDLSGRGAVRSQSIRAGSPVEKGKTIELQLAIY
jgi:cell division protein FtsI (penicillin-binding protein 3)